MLSIKKTFCVILFAATITAAVEVAANPAPKGVNIVAPAVTVPETLFVDPNGISTSLDNFNGKTVVINLWATWCGPCIIEMPSLDRLAAKLDPTKVVVLAVSQDKGGGAIAKPFLDKLGIKNLPAYTDSSGKLSRDLGIRGLPTTFIISPTGTIVGRVEGPLEWDSPEMVRFITSAGS